MNAVAMVNKCFRAQNPDLFANVPAIVDEYFNENRRQSEVCDIPSNCIDPEPIVIPEGATLEVSNYGANNDV